MAKRGRPKKKGAKDGRTLLRDTIALSAYDEARRRGEKHIIAISEAVSAARKWKLKMLISDTEVRRILAHWRPSRTNAWAGTSSGWINPPTNALTLIVRRAGR